MLRLLVIGDMHYKTSSLSSINFLEKEILRTMTERQPDGVVFLGDILDKHEIVHTDILNAAINFIQDCSQYVPIYVLIGNHDFVSNKVFLEPRHALNAMKMNKRVYIIDSPCNFHSHEEYFAALPYVPNGRFKEAWERLEYKDVPIVFAHQEFNGVCFSGITSESVEDVDDSYPLIVSGHIHDAQQIKHNLIYLGSPMMVAFGENKNKHVALLTIDHGHVKIEYIQLNVPKKLTIETTIEKIPELIFDGISSYRVKVKCETSTWASFRKSKEYQKLLSMNVKVIPETANIEIINNKKKESYLEILSGMIKKENNAELETFFQDILNNS